MFFFVPFLHFYQTFCSWCKHCSDLRAPGRGWESRRQSPQKVWCSAFCFDELVFKQFFNLTKYFVPFTLVCDIAQTVNTPLALQNKLTISISTEGLKWGGGWGNSPLCLWIHYFLHARTLCRQVADNMWAVCKQYQMNDSLKGVLHPYQKLTCLVGYLKIINTFLKNNISDASDSKMSKELKNDI